MAWVQVTVDGGEAGPIPTGQWRNTETGVVSDSPPSLAQGVESFLMHDPSSGFEGQGGVTQSYKIHGIPIDEFTTQLSGTAANGRPGGMTLNKLTGQMEKSYFATIDGAPRILPESLARQLDPNATEYFMPDDGGMGGGIGGLFERYGVPLMTAAVLGAGASGFGMPATPGAEPMFLADAGTVTDVPQGLLGSDGSWASQYVDAAGGGNAVEWGSQAAGGAGNISANSLGGQVAIDAAPGMTVPQTPPKPPTPPKEGDKTSTTDKIKLGASLASAAGALSPSTAGTGGTGDALLDAENARQAAIQTASKSIDDTFAGYDDNYYSGIAQAYKNYAMPQFQEQATEARRRLPLTVPNRTSSAYARKAGNLETDIGRQEANIGNEAIAQANRRRGEVESTKSQLLSLATTGAPVEAVASQAASQAQALNGVPSFSPLADLFGKYLENAATAATVMTPPATYQRPLLFSPSPSRSVRNVG